VAKQYRTIRNTKLASKNLALLSNKVLRYKGVRRDGSKKV